MLRIVQADFQEKNPCNVLHINEITYSNRSIIPTKVPVFTDFVPRRSEFLKNCNSWTYSEGALSARAYYIADPVTLLVVGGEKDSRSCLRIIGGQQDRLSGRSQLPN
jgi:hypothetical protein